MLELLLAAVLAILAYQHVRLRRKHRVLRHFFIEHSDWCANKIRDVSQSAIEQITQTHWERAETRGDQCNPSDFLGEVRNDILDATRVTTKQIDRVQSRLIRNGMPPLNYADLDATAFNPTLQRLIR
ncbi:hypothetical protein I5L01_12235 [Erythrobacter sp. YJ-T3-07]|uniref:hypothetical protein n=1 Tax=Erythrobacter sp. YJ-T3-07 TaxID=2793063 RepID=UPI0018D43793|nr:hypothetical protein [Erythrobacter sp. YJ-T3-07]MBH1944989.1 hypothetical protein [Erythrobacter sp. YJ-T3-07]